MSLYIHIMEREKKKPKEKLASYLLWDLWVEVPLPKECLAFGGAWAWFNLLGW